ncbi:MAG: methylated-DNA--[protein]-cysteine S-methyltransferase [Halioglobus sp.]
MTLHVAFMTTPIGTLQLYSNGVALTAIDWPDQQVVTEHAVETEDDVLRETKRQLQQYFNKEREQFDVPLDAGGTEFQNAVWNALRRIPYGEQCSYGDIAREINRPKAVRAVGAANGRNPIPIIVPCHRVIGSNGTLTGFAGGLALKRELLALEGAQSELWG